METLRIIPPTTMFIENISHSGACVWQNETLFERNYKDGRFDERTDSAI